jgi:hypothetical protein
MTGQDDGSFQDRLSRASKARGAALAKFKQALDPESPAAVEKRREREAIVAARAERERVRAAARQEQERELARQAALAKEAAAEAERAAAEKAALEAAERAEAEAALKAEQNAEGVTDPDAPVGSEFGRAARNQPVRGQPALMLAARITLPHFSVSLAMS